MSFEIIRRAEVLKKSEKHLERFGRGGKLRTCLIYPNTYHVGMSNLGFQAIYRIISSVGDVYCDRAFLPDEDVEKFYRKSKRKLIALKSERPVQEFDVVGFSISYELDFINVLKILQLSGIPLRARDRDSSHPLIIAGGAAVSINPEVIADFIDVFILGEAEKSVVKFFNAAREQKWENRKQFLIKAAEIPGIYVPSLYQVKYDREGFIKDVKTRESLNYPVSRQVVKDASSFAHSVIVTPMTEFSNTYLLEISRGCPYNCKFCCVSLHNKPFRYKNIDEIKKDIKTGLSVASQVGLMGAAAGSHPNLEEILSYVDQLGGKLSFASLRADVLKPEIIKKIGGLGQRTLTLAPETGSQKLRIFLNKTLSNQQVVEASSNAFKSGFKEVKLYFMVGIPGQDDSDLQSAINLVEKVKENARATGGKVSISINQLVPKPGTGMENYPLIQEKVAASQAGILQKSFYNQLPVSFKVESFSEMKVQSFLCRGNRLWGKYLEKFYKKSISNFASKIDKLREKDPSVNALLFEPISPDRIPPWSIVI